LERLRNGALRSRTQIINACNSLPRYARFPFREFGPMALLVLLVRSSATNRPWCRSASAVSEVTPMKIKLTFAFNRCDYASLCHNALRTTVPHHREGRRQDRRQISAFLLRTTQRGKNKAQGAAECPRTKGRRVVEERPANAQSVHRQDCRPHREQDVRVRHDPVISSRLAISGSGLRARSNFRIVRLRPSGIPWRRRLIPRGNG